MADELTVRRATADDFPGVLDLARRALGWTDDDASFLAWKHLENPFGESPMWIALDDQRTVGFRTFLRWEFAAPSGRAVRAVRAVDTATDPEYQGRGIFTRLTLLAVDSLPAEGVELIFNTPNSKSLPGYLKMGWSEVGRLPVAVMPTSWRFPLVVGTARRAAGRMPLPSEAGERATDVFQAAAVDALLASQPTPAGLATVVSNEYLRWRYGNPELGYQVVLTDTGRLDDGFAVFRRRRRGNAVEGVLCEVIAPEGDTRSSRALVRRVAAVADADYLLRIDARTITGDPFVRLPRTGPVLAWRPLDASPPPSLEHLALNMGDVELF